MIEKNTMMIKRNMNKKEKNTMTIRINMSMIISMMIMTIRNNMIMIIIRSIIIIIITIHMTIIKIIRSKKPRKTQIIENIVLDLVKS